jgi:periplasmic protein TonB
MPYLMVLVLSLYTCLSLLAPPSSKEDEPIYEVVDIPPVPKGGQQAVLKTLVKNLRYPASALEKGVEGLVAVEFVVEIDGSISQLAIARGIGYGCDEEAMRVVAMLKKWSPGILDGEAVRTRMKFPVKFKLG